LLKETLRFCAFGFRPAAAGDHHRLVFHHFRQADRRQLGPVDGLSYTQYIAPGLIMMAVITNAYSNVVSSFFSSKFQRHIEEMLVSPLTQYRSLCWALSAAGWRGAWRSGPW
jgi:ABC-2 type transport system permease protein